ncbi:hypothetical protein OG828_47080 [Streptomyces sp. NBC_00457]|uniref:hypothetical protein n=1 Tax=Streptomyces sp. NBC_00457 TaxID=2975748 RepID=UPI002E1F47A9
MELLKQPPTTRKLPAEWRGAAPGQFMIHLALWETEDITWPEHVPDDDYHGPRVSTRTPP